MSKRLWAELGPKWPRAFWDDWLREPANRRGRASIRPEISRTHTYGVKGVSSGQFSNFLRSMRLAEGGVDWAAMDVQWLTQSRYDQIFERQLAAAVEVAPSALPALGAADCTDGRISYNSHTAFEALAKQLGLMPELKAGVPRTAYRGVVTFRRGACRIFLAPTYDIDPETHSIVRS
jgi:alpha-1,3-mannosyl-glycoprotein beta-1,2-N-acetylglucosaminyltransferase